MTMTILATRENPKQKVCGVPPSSKGAPSLKNELSESKREIQVTHQEDEDCQLINFYFSSFR